jgi:mRNA-degrading endonuclease RelE of RelBE toxin-antitoxin system
MYSVEFCASARKEFLRLAKEDQRRVVAVLERIRMRPHAFALRLSGSRAYRIRAGRLRIIADILEESGRIVVLRVANRESVYLP